MIIRLFTLLFALVPFLGHGKVPHMDPIDVARVERLKSLEWGLFLHWSLGTFSGEEWTKGVTDPAFFAPTAVDTEDWCRAAAKAGMGYILLVPKHHDGFCLWDTDTTEFKSTRSPIATDVVAALRKSCDRYGLKLALYFSEGDWTWPNMEDGNLKRRQLEELCTRYGEIAFFWMDTAQGDGGLSHDETVALVKKHQPNCFVGFNHGAPAGDLQSREMGKLTPLTGPTAPPLSKAELDHLVEQNKRAVLALDWDTAAVHESRMYSQYDGYQVAECSVCINQKDGRWYWFYNDATRDNAIPADKIVAMYREARASGVLFSLATGPGKDGKLRPVDHQRLQEVAERIGTANRPQFPLTHRQGELHLRDQGGEPHFLFVDANWALPYYYTREEAVRYLNDRREKGFSMVKINAVPWNRTWNEAGDGAGHANAYGAPPFVDRNPFKPDERYWLHFDWLVHEAAKRGMQLLVETPEFFDPIETAGQAHAVGRFLGRRYGPAPNLVWLHGSDRNASPADAILVDAMVKGIRSMDTRHLHTFHPGAGHDSIEGLATLADTSWLGLVWAYAYRPGNPWGAIEPYVRAAKTFANAQGLPVYLGESGYEDEKTPTLNTAPVIRRQLYWSILNGTLAGHTYGHGKVWLRKPGWEEALQSPGAKHASLATRFFRDLPWHQYRPDSAALIVTENRVPTVEQLAQKGNSHVACAMRVDGKGAVIYLPPDRGPSEPVELDLSSIPGRLLAKWVDPTTGHLCAEEPWEGGAMQSLTPRKNAEGAHDWIIRLDPR